jgi:hypothetical protein
LEDLSPLIFEEEYLNNVGMDKEDDLSAVLFGFVHLRATNAVTQFEKLANLRFMHHFQLYPDAYN